MKKWLSTAVAAIALLIGIAVVSVQYYRFVSQTIYSESVSHLTEIFRQANGSLYMLVGKTWSNLHLWADYVRDVRDEDGIDRFIAHAGLPTPSAAENTLPLPSLALSASMVW